MVIVAQVRDVALRTLISNVLSLNKINQENKLSLLIKYYIIVVIYVEEYTCQNMLKFKVPVPEFKLWKYLRRMFCNSLAHTSIKFYSTRLLKVGVEYR